MAKRNRYALEFKARAVREVLRGRSEDQVAGDLEIAPPLLAMWRQTAVEGLWALLSCDVPRSGPARLAAAIWFRRDRLEIP